MKKILLMLLICISMQAVSSETSSNTDKKQSTQQSKEIKSLKDQELMRLYIAQRFNQGQSSSYVVSTKNLNGLFTSFIQNASQGASNK